MFKRFFKRIQENNNNHYVIIRESHKSMIKYLESLLFYLYFTFI